MSNCCLLRRSSEKRQLVVHCGFCCGNRKFRLVLPALRVTQWTVRKYTACQSAVTCGFTAAKRQQGQFTNKGNAFMPHPTSKLKHIEKAIQRLQSANTTQQLQNQSGVYV